MTSVTIIEERKNTIKNIVADILEIELEEMTETSRFQEDHNADSLRAIEILASLEKEFQIEIPQSELVKMNNLSGVYEVVKQNAGWDK
ncbi:acyl carrier protein [Nostoc favosum]|uniref:Acyl carrier protein n=1 Tax=Nostoc favosum CHAB5714 TaxID=2780399 RepID=A0ABS8IGU7_9NOSO|nr:phosphopantetheine-binding protein [Nostoc favosum]MCC5603261.1 phosphopantetheine-binding protein [Nostoc favosum CHAB5714]